MLWGSPSQSCFLLCIHPQGSDRHQRAKPFPVHSCFLPLYVPQAIPLTSQLHPNPAPAPASWRIQRTHAFWTLSSDNPIWCTHLFPPRPPTDTPSYSLNAFHMGSQTDLGEEKPLSPSGAALPMTVDEEKWHAETPVPVTSWLPQPCFLIIHSCASTLTHPGLGIGSQDNRGSWRDGEDLLVLWEASRDSHKKCRSLAFLNRTLEKQI